LVCKSWTPSCRKHIFYRVRFDNPSEFALWGRSISPAPNGPHLHTRELTVDIYCFESEYYSPPNDFTLFLQHLLLFRNVQDLAIVSSACQRMLDNISAPKIFGHLFDTLRSLSIQTVSCSPQTLLSFIASFNRLGCLKLIWVWFESSGSPHPLPQRHTFKGSFYLSEWEDSSEEFITLLAEHDLQFRGVHVTGVHWLRDTVWNRCLEKCADNLEQFGIHWSGREGESTFCQFSPFVHVYFKTPRKADSKF
jgi:hypothetical protein